MKEIKECWTTKNGNDITVTGKLITEKVINLDGDKVKVECCEIEMSIYAEGHGEQGDWIRELSPAEIKNLTKQRGAHEYTHYVGDLALTLDQVKIIESVRTRLESTPEWQAKLAKEKINKKENEEYNKKLRRNGLCPKCGTFCYGDCSSN